MFYYARADTHFLLYIYDNMRNELIDKANPEDPEQNCVELVIAKSKETSLLRFERQIYNAASGKGPGGWYQLLAKTPALFSSEQLAVFRAVHEWRDKIARLEDDSTAFVMPNHVIFSIAKLMPMDMIALLGIAHPISYSVKSRSGELLDIIKTAKAEGSQGPSMMDVLRPGSLGAIAKTNLSGGATKSTATSLVSTVDENHLVTAQSSFWGNAFGSSIWDSPASTKQDNSLRLAVPLPQLSSEIYAEFNGQAERSIEEATPSTDHIPLTTPNSKESNDTFVLKRGAEQKNDAASEPEEAGNSDSVGLAALKAERKAANKLRKKQIKEEKRTRTQTAAEKAPEEEEPFDYSKAEPVLHGKRKGGEQDGPKSKKPFNPYAKSADAPKGMRRVQTERAGKSHTFKG